MGEMRTVLRALKQNQNIKDFIYFMRMRPIEQKQQLV